MFFVVAHFQKRFFFRGVFFSHCFLSPPSRASRVSGPAVRNRTCGPESRIFNGNGFSGNGLREVRQLFTAEWKFRPPNTRAPAPLTDWNQMKKRELEFLDVCFLKKRRTNENPRTRQGQPKNCNLTYGQMPAPLIGVSL